TGQPVTWGSGALRLLRESVEEKNFQPFVEGVVIRDKQEVKTCYFDSLNPLPNSEESLTLIHKVVETKWVLGHGEMNVKMLHQFYSEIHGLNKSGRLSKCMNKYGLQFKGRKHNAVDDALNTA